VRDKEKVDEVMVANY